MCVVWASQSLSVHVGAQMELWRKKKRWDRNDKRRSWGEKEQGGNKINLQQSLLPVEWGLICCQLFEGSLYGKALMGLIKPTHLHRGRILNLHTYLPVPPSWRPAGK